MASVVYKIVTYLFLLIAVRGTSVQPKQLVYIDEVNGTLDLSCWEEKAKPPYSGVEVALDDVELYNSTLVVVKPKCKCEEFQKCAADASLDWQCPTWFFPDPSSNGTCRCGDDVHGTVKCNDSTKEAFISSSHCMTYNESTGPVVGVCFYNFLRHTLYDLVPCNITELNNYMCGQLNREGQLCGRCKEDYSVPVYSYDLKCVQCSTSPFNWILYILAAFLPLTVFFVLVLSCRISATSPKLLTFVCFSQFVSAGANMRVFVSCNRILHHCFMVNQDNGCSLWHLELGLLSHSTATHLC